MKMSRRKLRETIFLFLFRIEFNTKDELMDQFAWYFEQKEDVMEEDVSYIREKLEAVLGCVKELDDTILHICKGWRLSRLGKAELAILRLAVYEMKYDNDIPTGVAINEAVALAKIYCSEEAPRFVNGVLAKLA